MHKTQRLKKIKNKKNKKYLTKKRKLGGFFNKYIQQYVPSTKKNNSADVPVPATNVPSSEDVISSENVPNSADVPSSSDVPANADVSNSTKGFSKSSDYIDYSKNILKGNRNAINMPVILDSINSKLNALLIHNKVNYKFSNGYTALDYNIESIAAESNNDGRGELNNDVKRGKVTGFQSGVYTKTMGV